MKEIETKIIDINEREVRERLAKIGAKKIGNLFYRRYVFFLTDKKEIDEFVRVRTDGKKTTITYKYREGMDIGNKNLDFTFRYYNQAGKDNGNLYFKKQK